MTQTLELITGIASMTMCVGMLVGASWFIGRLPADYFIRPRRKHSLPMMIARNVLGTVLIVVGIALLVLPGQGIITILFGLSILDLPIKDRILRWLLQRPKIQKAVQTLRAKAGKPALIIPAHA